VPEDRVAIELEGVSKRFGKAAAVNDVSLAIREGEFFSLLGPSGCGKTTTLRMIAGFEVPDEGRILLQGDDVTTVFSNRRPVNMVFQQYALFPHMSIYDNVAFGLKVKRVPRREHEGRVREMLRVVELEGYESRKSRQLSAGPPRTAAPPASAASLRTWSRPICRSTRSRSSHHPRYSFRLSPLCRPAGSGLVASSSAG
jgi:spermidine/putrescine transport system ATP-binding protein